ncbi:2-isopropylmalate synthase/homocitrate synthase family protein [Desulfofarcimen acetoxidans DSM 771]|jgi:2-isopropylmalate synthase|uniref:Citramalate synthase n=1 Tax=Desulfofarcimen acetoxidans (strain ATCC 49208 / DSM 771 / KCTC 5769 / VKM B-1644 / 5575) TaxID=485916 RepID=C8W663_DESAS|nr:citramalate synthase [Desulfofarcimen acetoxidans]ACV61518.1 2-isopropylmalate synthase/homocitrate synthase family protein [Desulfofarcimen acetoxidans DSM 771]
MSTIEIYDTTLRDGAQGEGISFSVEDKVKIALRLDKLGVHYIEGGWPGSNPKDSDFFKRIKDFPLEKAVVSAFGSTRKPNSDVKEDVNLKAIVDAGVQVACIFGKTWDFQVVYALNTTLEENLQMIKESVAYLKSNGMQVFYDAEHFFDGCKANTEYALETVKAAQAGGADRIVLCDTNGGTMPWDIQEIVSKVKSVVTVPLGIHCHNDSEMAAANSVIAVQSGVIQVQGTMNGYGERCGNANLCSVIPNLEIKCGLKCLPEGNLAQLTEVSRFVSEVANMHLHNGQPFVGTSAFAHKGGIHVSAIMKNSKTYEHITPELVGNQRRVLVSDQSGLSNLLYKFKELNVDLTQQTEENKQLLMHIKELENQGYQFEGADGSFELLMRRISGQYENPFKLESLRVIMDMKENGPTSTEATIKIWVGDQVKHTAAEGNGPVNALDNALRKSLEGFYPAIKEMQLNDYKVRVLNEKEGTDAVVRVSIETGDGKNSWGTIGVSTNIMEASWQALVDSLAYGLLKQND